MAEKNQSANSRGHIWLRAETKPQERRTAVTPSVARQLLAAGYQLTVEESDQSAFPVSSYVDAGCKIAPKGSWQSASDDAIVVGLKELPQQNTPLRHRHVHFAHAFKNQRGWKEFLKRFDQGNGSLFDLEYLVDDDGRRVAAFGRWAGFAGAALAAMAWAGQKRKAEPVLGAVKPCENERELISNVQAALNSASNSTPRSNSVKQSPRALVIGALGRSGRGAVELLTAANVAVDQWDIAETESGGPFSEILDYDIVINCVFVQSPIPPFLTAELLQSSARKLSVICDVSCDPYGDCNPLPIYDSCTTFDNPTLRIIDGENPVDLIAIDHLPSLLPVESSEDFAKQLLPTLMNVDRPDHGVWKRSLGVFQEKMLESTNASDVASKRATVHWLGAGLSSPPGIQRLAQIPGRLVVWNRTAEKASEVIAFLNQSKKSNAESRQLDWAALEAAIEPGDVVVSMLPANMHLQVANLCLDRKAHFASSSYLSPELLALSTKAAGLGLSFVGECGLDPGIDHLMAHALVHDYSQSANFNPANQHFFRSYCGGLTEVPNDFRYKFSWSPLGVLRALTNTAKWIGDGEERSADKVWETLSTYEFGGADQSADEIFLAYPNRNSLPYVQEYGLGEWNVQEFIRGTLRYPGWDEAWKEIFALVDSGEGPEWEMALKEKSDQLWQEYQFAEGESDRVVLCVELEVRSAADPQSPGNPSNQSNHPNQSQAPVVWHEVYSLDALGNDSGSAMARLVSLPVSIAVESIIAGKMPTGVSGAPSQNFIVRDWMDQLRAFGENIVHSKVVQG